MSSDLYSGLGGALMLSQQLSTYRLLDSMEESRDARREIADYANLSLRYNELVRKSDLLCVKVTERVAADGERIARQRARILALKAEKAELKERVAALEREKLALEGALEHEKSMCDSYTKNLYPDIPF